MNSVDWDQFKNQVKESTSLIELANTYGLNLRKAGKEYSSICIFHEEKTPSLFLNDQVYYCQGCGAKGDVITFAQETQHLDFKGALRFLADRAAIPYPNGSGNHGKPEIEAEILAIYDYPGFQVVRFDTNIKEDRFRHRRPDGNGGWIWSSRDIPKVLYHAEKIKAASDVFICEGEKDVLALEKIGFTATTNPCGAGNW